MAFRQSRQILAGYPVINTDGASDAVTIVADYIVTSALAANDVIEMLGVAEGMIVTDCSVVTEDADTGSALTLDAGVLSGPYGALTNTDGSQRTCGNELFAASAIAQTGGLQRANKGNAMLITPNLDIVPYGVKVAAGPAGVVVGARIRMILEAISAPVGV